MGNGITTSARSAPECKVDEPSPLGMGGGKFGIDDDQLGNARERHFNTLVYRSRRPSDLALIAVILDPVICHSFRRYMYKSFKEPLMNFWVECNAYAQIHAGNLVTKQKAAAHIYHIFLAKNAPYKDDFQIDAPTRDQIEKDLKVREESDGVFVVKQTSEAVLRDVFKLAAGKIFQVLKFEHLEEFVVSNEADDLLQEYDMKERTVQDDDGGRARKKNEVIDVEIMLRNPVGMFWYSKFVKENGLFEGMGQFLFDLLYEIDMYDNCDDPAVQQRRLKKIMTRYKTVDLLLEVEKLLEKAKNGNIVAVPGNRSPLYPLKEEIMELLEGYGSTFTMTKHYRRYKDEEAGTSRTKGALRSITDYAEAKGITGKMKGITFIQVLNHNIGLSYFKKYAIDKFMEDSILFWISVQNFKSAIELAPKDNLDEPLHDRCKRLGQQIIDNFILEDSPQQVNISDAQREKTVQDFNAEVCEPTVFDMPEKEIVDLMKRNLWNGFRQDNQFKYLKDKLKEQGRKVKKNVSDLKQRNLKHSHTQAALAVSVVAEK